MRVQILENPLLEFEEVESPQIEDQQDTKLIEEGVNSSNENHSYNKPKRTAITSKAKNNTKVLMRLITKIMKSGLNKSPRKIE